MPAIQQQRRCSRFTLRWDRLKSSPGETMEIFLTHYDRSCKKAKQREDYREASCKPRTARLEISLS